MRAACLLALGLVSQAAASAPPRPVRVAAAANLRPALEELAASFRAAGKGEVKPTYGASGTLAAQLLQGAPFDLFLSADEAAPARLAAAGLAQGEPFVYARGRLALWVLSSSPIQLGSLGLRAAADPRVARVALPNPEVAPTGAAARTALVAAGLWEQVRPKVVFGQSAQQAAQFAQSGAAQLAVLPLSLCLAPPLAAEGRHLALPEGPVPLRQAGVVLRAARDPAAAHALREHLLAPAAQAVWARHGFATP